MKKGVRRDLSAGFTVEKSYLSLLFNRKLWGTFKPSQALGQLRLCPEAKLEYKTPASI